MGMVIQFDTLRYVEKLKAAGVSEAQAKAGAEALAGAFSEATSGALASKDDINFLKLDIASVKVEMANLRSDVKLVHWAIPLILAMILPGALKAIGLIH